MADWIVAGQDYGTFWRLTPRQISLVLNCYADRRIKEHDEARLRNFEMAQLIAYAFHSPKTMPKFKPTSAPSGPKEDEEGVRAFFIGLAMKGQE